MRHAVILSLLVLATGLAHAATIKVPTDQPTIQDGINAASDFDTILVEPGTYTGAGNQDINFAGKRLAVFGEKGRDSTLLDLTGTGLNGFMLWDPPVDSGATLSGFTITGAHKAIEGQPLAFPISDMRITACDFGIIPYEYSPGSFDNSGSFIITDVIFDSTAACVITLDGAISNCTFSHGTTALSHPYFPLDSITVSHCTFDNFETVSYFGSSEKSRMPKSLAQAQQIPYTYVILFDSCTFTFNTSVFQGRVGVNNSSLSHNGRIYVDAYIGKFFADNCNFMNNDSTLFTYSNGNVVNLTNCVIADNASGILDAPCGPECFVEDGIDLDIHDCLISHNGGGIIIDRPTWFAMSGTTYAFNAQPIRSINQTNMTAISISQSTFIGNDSGAISLNSGLGTLENDTVKNIIADSNGLFGISVDVAGGDTLPGIVCSNLFQNDNNYVGIPDQTGSNGNISADPLFYDTTNGNYNPCSHSPCAPANNSCGILMGAYSVISMPPSAPSLILPPDSSGKPTFNMLPTFNWQVATDPDPFDTVRYRLEIAADSSFLSVITFDSLTNNEHTATDSLEFGTHYYWRVTAFDTDGLIAQSGLSNFWTWMLGDINHTHTVTVQDLTYLVAFLFNGGDPISPLFVGDLNGNCSVTIQDLTYIVRYLFIAGPAPKIGCEP